MQEAIDFGRVAKALAQMTRNDSAKRETLDKVLAILPTLAEMCGPFSQTRRMALLVGKRLLDGDRRILVPCCPDYSHQDGRYTFRGLGGGISLLAQKHIEFLGKLDDLIPGMQILFLYADHEVDNPDLVKVTGKTRREFSELIVSSVERTKESVGSRGWVVGFMTEAIPNLISEEERMAEWIANSTCFRERITRETWSRSEMYYRIRHTFTEEEMRLRTIKTAAQYVALGNFAAANGYLVCNHTTVNLSWYLQTEAALLHNPVSIY